MTPYVSLAVALPGLLLALVLMTDRATAQPGTTRPVYVFGGSSSAPLRDQVAALLASKRDLADRDITLVEVGGDDVRTWLGLSPQANAQSLRARFGVPPGAFRIILVGKDGGVKLTSNKPVSVDRLLGLIDSMPMRRREMQR